MLAVTLAVLLLGAGPGAMAEARYRSPTSDAERALDRILRRAEADGSVLDNLFDGRGKRGFRPAVDYRTMLTAGLLAAMVRAERDQVRRECAGRYQDGEICGLDYNPITCAQDTTGPRRYAIMTESDDGARIVVRAASSGPEDATYVLARENGRVTLDAIACASGASFNFR